MEETRKSTNYWPLFCLLFATLAMAISLTYGTNASLLEGMHFFMGIFFTLFAMFKFFNLSGFVQGFALYDLVAKKVRFYGYIYPFIELALGISYLTFFMPYLTYILTAFFMALGALGVLIALRKGLKTLCACMGTTLQVPLSTVTLSEDILMGVMALSMLIFSLS